ncbi:vasorin [Tiliqua scincoides]|uniref:vasorin n=1 Tax=Tiliqua scincoides TaxID=71010 RepID=UPI0034622154
MRPSALWALLLLPAGVLAQGCPADCQCNQPRTVFCISRRSHTVPHGLPPDTASLYIFENGIRALSEDSFVEVPALQLLDLSQNQLSSLPRNVFQSLPSLCNLDLSSNQLHEISNETFHGLHLLERLYLDHNRIQHIHPAAFSSLENLLELKLQDNQLHVVPPLSLPTLLLLDISRNRVTALEPGTFHAPNLESLKMAGLGLGRLDEELLHSLQNLHELDISGNLLARVPRVLRQLRGLTKLSLAGNGQISQLQPEDFQELHSLQELDISKLSLHSLPRDFFGSFSRLKVITAAENPFNCVCQLSWLVHWLSTSKVSLRRSEETRCHFPPKNAGRLLQHLEYADFGCPTTTTLKATSPKLATSAPSSRHVPPTPSAAGSTPGEGSSTATPSTVLEGDPSPETRLCPPHTCLNGGACQLDTSNHLECVCPPGFSGLYCETKVWATTPPAATQAPTHPTRVAIKHVGGTSLKVDLQNYVQSKTQLKGIRLTYRNLSGPDKRPVTLSLPASLAEYTVRALKPNSSYHICIGPLGDRGQEEDLCVEAHTLQLTQQQQHAPVTQGRDPNLALVVVPAMAAVLLLVAAVAAVSYYARRRRQGKTPATPVVGSGPLELEGVKACLENGDLAGHGQRLPEKTVMPHGLEYEVPLMQPQYTSAATPRALRPSYF